MTAIFSVTMALKFNYKKKYFENKIFATKMCFKSKKSDVMAILSILEIEPADRLNTGEFHSLITAWLSLVWTNLRTSDVMFLTCLESWLQLVSQAHALYGCSVS